MANRNKYIWEIPSIPTMRDEDRFLIVSGTSEYLLTKENLQKVLDILTAEEKSKLSKIEITGEGNAVFSNNGEYLTANQFLATQNLLTNLENTLVDDNWSNTIPFTQTLYIDVITENTSPIIDIIINTEDTLVAIAESKEWSYITKAVTGDGSITFYCYENKPTINLNVKVKVM